MKYKKELLSLYSFRLPFSITYMLQASEYKVDAYLKWLKRTHDFSAVQNRKKLDLTSKAKLTLAFLSVGMLVELLAGLALAIYGLVTPGALWAIEMGVAITIAYPLIWPVLIILPLEFARVLVVEPSLAKQVSKSSAIFAKHKAIKIAVAGSYGKTTMKELLTTVLGEGKEVVSTLANKNVASEHAKLASNLSGKEDIIILEYGEGAPGDVANFAKNTHPDYAIITGLAPAHLDRYKSLKDAGEDIFSVADYLKGKNVYVNGESESIGGFLKKEYISYDQKGLANWQVRDIEVSIDGLSFSLSDGKQTLNLNSRLIGRHQVGPLALVAVLAIKLGLSKEQVVDGIAKTEPFEHRMQPYELNGAWIIDDTYNGNIDGIKAGTELLKELDAKRKIYVTPGLVDQGKENVAVHETLGKLIASANPNIVVLMKNSVTKYIEDGLKQANFKGEVILISDPLSFYSSLDSFVANGDLVLMQNDWPDNYA